MTKKINKYVYWPPRILSILFVLFISVFAFDVFDSGYTFWETVLALFMHLLPSFILAGVIWISWKREVVGGAVFIAFGIAYIARTIGQFAQYSNKWYIPIMKSMPLAGPALLIGVLFLINWKQKNKKIKQTQK